MNLRPADPSETDALAGRQVLELAPDVLGTPGVLQVAVLDDPAMWRE